MVLLLWPRNQTVVLPGCCFQDISEIQEQLRTVLHAIPKCHFQHWQKHWTHCINLKGDYFECDNNDQ
jgi:hypothetical protein